MGRGLVRMLLRSTRLLRGRGVVLGLDYGASGATDMSPPHARPPPADDLVDLLHIGASATSVWMREWP